MTETNDPSGTPTPLDEAIAEFFQAQEAGGNPDPRTWIERYPDLRDGLREFFSDQARFQQAAATIQGPPRAAAPARVRYFGDYELLDEIARGGMGVVYRARQVSLNRTVALKMILSGHLAGPEDVRRFRTEAESAAALDHPNIVPIYEIGEHEGQHYFAMKHVDGNNLAKEAPRFAADARSAAALMVAVARAVSYAHQHGILHRDLKPANVLIDAQGAPHVTDFGLAKRVREADGTALTESGTLMGTPAYMSPEQAVGDAKRLTTAADVYSLGAILYELLAGRAPFTGETVFAVLTQVRNDEPKPPRAVRPEVDRDLEVICLRCLEKDPAKRYASAEALAEDLERWLRGEPIEARPVRAVERLVKWARRRPVVAALGGAILLTAALGIGGVVWQWRRAEARRLDAERSSALARAAQAEAERRGDELRLSLYATDMNYASAAFHGGDVGRTNTLLSRYGPDPHDRDLRGFEWHYLWRATHSEGRTFDDFEATVGNSGVLALSPDGSTLAMTVRPDTLRIWDLKGAKELHSLSLESLAPGYAVRSLCFSQNGVTLRAVMRKTSKGLLTAFRQTPKDQEVIKGTAPPSLEGFLGDFFVMEIDPSVQRPLEATPFAQAPAPLTLASLLDVLKSHGIWMKDHLMSPMVASSSADGKTIVFGGFLTPVSFDASAPTDPSFGDQGFESRSSRLRKVKGCVMVWDIEGAAPRWINEEPGALLSAVALAPDETSVASATFEGAVVLWDARSGERQMTLTPPASGTALAYSGDGKRLAIGCAEGSVTLWDLAERRLVQTIKGHSGSIQTLAFSRDDRVLVSGGTDRSVRVWDLMVPSNPRICPGHQRTVQDLAWTPGGETVLSVDMSGIVIRWDSRTGRESGRARAWKNVVSSSVALAGDGSELAWGIGRAQVSMGTLVGDTVEPATSIELGERRMAECVAFSGDKSILVTSSRARGLEKEPRVEFWDGRTRVRVGEVRNYDKLVRKAVLSRDGRLLATVSAEEKEGVLLWDVPTGKPRGVLQSGSPISTLAIWPDGRRLATAITRGDVFTVTVWDVEQCRELYRREGLTYAVNHLAVSPDGRRLVLSGASEHRGRSGLYLWDAESGQELTRLDTRDFGVGRASFSPDGRRLAAVCTPKETNLMSSKNPEIWIWDSSAPEGK